MELVFRELNVQIYWPTTAQKVWVRILAGVLKVALNIVKKCIIKSNRKINLFLRE